MAFRKIINDPVYGFITIDDELIYHIISHPYYQRLRRIHQMAFAELVYPGAVHSRLHHSLGAFHLVCNAIHELKNAIQPIVTKLEVGRQKQDAQDAVQRRLAERAEAIVRSR